MKSSFWKINLHEIVFDVTVILYLKFILTDPGVRDYLMNLKTGKMGILLMFVVYIIYPWTFKFIAIKYRSHKSMYEYLKGLKSGLFTALVLTGVAICIGGGTCGIYTWDYAPLVILAGLSLFLTSSVLFLVIKVRDEAFAFLSLFMLQAVTMVMLYVLEAILSRSPAVTIVTLFNCGSLIALCITLYIRRKSLKDKIWIPGFQNFIDLYPALFKVIVPVFAVATVLSIINFLVTQLSSPNSSNIYFMVVSGILPVRLLLFFAPPIRFINLVIAVATFIILNVRFDFF